MSDPGCCCPSRTRSVSDPQGAQSRARLSCQQWPLALTKSDGPGIVLSTFWEVCHGTHRSVLFYPDFMGEALSSPAWSGTSPHAVTPPTSSSGHSDQGPESPGTHTHAHTVPGGGASLTGRYEPLGTRTCRQRPIGLGPESQTSASTQSCPAAPSKNGHSHDRTTEQEHLDPLAKAGQLAGAGNRKGCRPRLARGAWATGQMERTQVSLEGTFWAIIPCVCVLSMRP